MNVPHPLENTSRLKAGYTFEDGSILELGDTGGRGEHDHKIMRYLITDAAGVVIADGSDLEASPLARDYGAIMSDLLMFLQHDAEMYEYTPAGSWGKRYPNIAQAVRPEDFAFGERVAAWAVEHAGELDECCVVCFEIQRRLSDVRTKRASQTSPEKRSACLLP